MTPRFITFIPFIFEWETEFNSDGSARVEHDPDDPGGTTKYGIDQRSHPNEDIEHLTRERAQEIYFEEYWQKARCEDLPKNVGEVVMNIAVNAGHRRAGRWLQEAINQAGPVPSLVVDGSIGPKTIAEANLYRGSLAEALLDRTEEHYRSIAHGRLAKFLRGWLNRNNALREWVANL